MKMAKKKHRVYSHDGDGYANNQAACQRYAEDMGLRWGQYEVVQEEASNLCQTAALYVTDAAKEKIDRKKRQWEAEAYG